MGNSQQSMKTLYTLAVVALATALPNNPDSVLPESSPLPSQDSALKRQETDAGQMLFAHPPSEFWAERISDGLNEDSKEFVSGVTSRSSCLKKCLKNDCIHEMRPQVLKETAKECLEHCGNGKNRKAMPLAAVMLKKPNSKSEVCKAYDRYYNGKKPHPCSDCLWEGCYQDAFDKAWRAKAAKLCTLNSRLSRRRLSSGGKRRRRASRRCEKQESSGEPYDDKGNIVQRCWTVMKWIKQKLLEGITEGKSQNRGHRKLGTEYKKFGLYKTSPMFEIQRYLFYKEKKKYDCPYPCMPEGGPYGDKRYGKDYLMQCDFANYRTCGMDWSGKNAFRRIGDAMGIGRKCRKANKALIAKCNDERKAIAVSCLDKCESAHNQAYVHRTGMVSNPSQYAYNHYHQQYAMRHGRL